MRLKHLLFHFQKLYGNLPIVILAGDMYRNVSLYGPSLYKSPLDSDCDSDYESVNVNLHVMHKSTVSSYREFFDKAVILDDDLGVCASDDQWLNLLRRLRLCVVSEVDVSRINSHVLTTADNEGQTDDGYNWSTAITYASTSAYSNSMNFKALTTEVPASYLFIVSNAQSLSFHGGRSMSVEKMCDVLATLGISYKPEMVDSPIGIGARVEITAGISFEWGVCPHETGVVQGYITNSGQELEYVLVKLDNPFLGMPTLEISYQPLPDTGDTSVLSFPNTWPVSVYTQVICLYSPILGMPIYVDNKSFPLKLAYVRNISDVSTDLEHAVFDLSNCSHSQMPYRALSSVKCENSFRLVKAVKQEEINRWGIHEPVVSHGEILLLEHQRLFDLEMKTSSRSSK